MLFLMFPAKPYKGYTGKHKQREGRHGFPGSDGSLAVWNVPSYLKQPRETLRSQFKTFGNLLGAENYKSLQPHPAPKPREVSINEVKNPLLCNSCKIDQAIYREKWTHLWNFSGSAYKQLLWFPVPKKREAFKVERQYSLDAGLFYSLALLMKSSLEFNDCVCLCVCVEKAFCP